MWQKAGSKVVGSVNPKMLNKDVLHKIPITGHLQEFVGQSQISRLECFKLVWSYIKTNNLQDGKNKNEVICDDKLKSIVQGKSCIDLLDLPMLIKAHFPKVPK